MFYLSDRFGSHFIRYISPEIRLIEAPMMDDDFILAPKNRDVIYCGRAVYAVLRFDAWMDAIERSLNIKPVH